MTVERIVPNLSSTDVAASRHFYEDVGLDLVMDHGWIAAALEIVHPLSEEAWGVRRFFVRDPNGHVVNIVANQP